MQGSGCGVAEGADLMGTRPEARNGNPPLFLNAASASPCIFSACTHHLPSRASSYIYYSLRSTHSHLSILSFISSLFSTPLSLCLPPPRSLSLSSFLSFSSVISFRGRREGE